MFTNIAQLVHMLPSAAMLSHTGLVFSLGHSSPNLRHGAERLVQTSSWRFLLFFVTHPAKTALIHSYQQQLHPVTENGVCYLMTYDPMMQLSKKERKT